MRAGWVKHLILFFSWTGVGLFVVSLVYADSEEALRKKAQLWGIAGGIFTAAAVVDGVNCAASWYSGDKIPGTLRVVWAGYPVGSCVEMVVAGGLAMMAFDKQKNLLKIRKEQIGNPAVAGPDGGPPPDRTKCSPEEERNCLNLARITKIKRGKDCTCTPANPPVGINGEITDPNVAQAVPESIQDAIKDAMQKGDPGVLLDAVEKETGADFGKFASTESLAGAFNDALKSPEISGQLEALAPEGEEAVDEEKGEGIAFGDGAGKGGADAGKYITGQTQLDALQNRLKGKEPAKDKKGKITVDKGSGIIADEKRGLFVAVTRRYQSVETSELKGSLIEQRGKYTEVKFIPDPGTVQEAVEKTKLGKKKTSLSEDIQKFENP